MQLVSCQNSFGINGNDQNNMLTLATGMMTSSYPWLLLHIHIHTKTDLKIASVLYF
jgi:hypothetical protein